MALTDNLVAYYKMNVDAKDSLGVHNGSGYTSGAGKIGNGCIYSGAGTATIIADSADWAMGSGDFTVSAWIKRTATGVLEGLLGQINSAGQNITISFLWEILANNTVSVFFGQSGTSNEFAATSTTALTSTTDWYHIVQVRRGGTMYVYINGVQEGSVSIAGLSMTDSATNFAIGRCGDYTGISVKAVMDEIAIYKGKGLSDTEIAQLYNNDNALTWPFGTGFFSFFKE